MASIPWWGMLGAGLKGAEMVGGGMNDTINALNAVNNFRSSRNTNDALTKLHKYATSDEALGFEPEGYVNPQDREALYKLQKGRVDELQGREATSALGQFAGDYQNIAGTANPRFFGDPESRAEMVKAGLQIPASRTNPLISQGVASFANQGNEADTVANVFSGHDPANIGTDLSSIAINKDLATGFDTAARGAKDVNQEKTTNEEKIADNAMNAVIGAFPLTKDIGSWNMLVNLLRHIPNLKSDRIDNALKAIQSRNEGPVGQPVVSNAQSGNTTSQRVTPLDMFSQPVKGMETVATSHPTAAEMGLAAWQNRPEPKEKKVASTMVDKDGNTVSGTLDLDTNTFTPATTAGGEVVHKPQAGNKTRTIQRKKSGPAATDGKPPLSSFWK